ncbi:MAG: hypothetical protein SF029_00540 [bacterium]|nr:hypothetical protein [bacterium]
MSKKLTYAVILLLTLVLFALGMSISLAQTATPIAPTVAGPSSNINVFLVICDRQAVMNLTGTMITGEDVYYQVFNGPNGTGTAITGLRRVQVDGTFAFSEVATYNEGQTIAAGGTGSATVSIGRESNPSNTSFTTTVNDLQDGCAQPQNPAATSQAISGGTTGTTGTTTTTTSGTFTQIRSPFGGFINPGYVPPDDPIVVIGARPEGVLPRQQTPGIIFAECNQYPQALPGIVYDTDDVILFWSWFARTPELVQEHINTVTYAVLYYDRIELPNITVTPIQQIGSNYWVFYYSRLGNLRPGRYFFNFKARWSRAISDGYDEFGPGTDNPLVEGGCGFEIYRNLENTSVSYNPWPYNIIGNPPPPTPTPTRTPTP